MPSTQDGAAQIRFRAGHASDPDWSAATQAAYASLGQALPGANLGFVYVADVFANRFDRIVSRLRELSGIEHWVGTVGMGVIGGRTEYFGAPAIAVMIAGMPADAFRLLSIPSGDTFEPAGDLADWIMIQQPTLGLLHADPRCENLVEVIADVAEGSNAFLTGGLASSDGSMPQVADGIAEGGVSGVLFGRGLGVSTGLSQGCTPLGPTRTVTDSVRNIVVALDGEPALNALLADTDLTREDDLPRALASVHVALPVPGSDVADYMVRNLIGIDPSAGAMGIATLPDPGDRLMFVRRDARAAETDLRRMLRDLKSRVEGEIAGAVYVSCLARGPNLFEGESREAGIIAEELGEVPLIGFFANGEISNARLYGYTGVLTLFTRAA